MANTNFYNEDAIIAQIAEGSEPAFRELFDHYRPQLYTAALRMTGDAVLAQDIYQDIFLKVWLKRSTLPGIGNFPGWLYTVAQNVLYDAIKRSDKSKTGLLHFLDQWHSDAGADPEVRLREKEIQQVLNAAIAQLPDKQRQTYQLIKVEQLSREEAASRMNVSAETVKSNLDHAMRSIRAWCLKELEINPALLQAIIFLSIFS